VVFDSFVAVLLPYAWLVIFST